MPFRSSAVVRTDDGKQIMLVEPMAFDRADGSTIIVPATADSDGPSVPGRLTSLISPIGTGAYLAGILHDSLYRGTARDGAGKLFAPPRDVCDDIFLEALVDQGVPLASRAIFYWCVRLFGKRSFDEDRKRVGLG